MVYFAVRVRGTVGVRPEIRKALELLRMRRKHTGVILPENSSILGMLQKSKDYITFGKARKEVLVKLLEKRGRTEGDKRITPADLKAMKLASFDELAEKAMSGAKLKDFGIKPFFRLSPPSGGFKGSIKRAMKNKGELGDRGERINELFEKMI